MSKKQSSLNKVRIQLKWYANAAFTGIFVAKDKGFFAAEGIDAEIIQGDVGTKVDQLVAAGRVDVGVSSLDSVMYSEQKGLPIVSMAQIFQGSSQGIATLKSSGIDTMSKLRGKTIGTFGGVNELQLLALLNKYYLTNRVKLVIQGSMKELLTKAIDVASIAEYNQLQPPFPPGLYPDNLNILMFNQVGVGMLEDTIVTRKDLVDRNPKLCARVVGAILRGWRYTYTNPKESLAIMMRYVRKGRRTREHQARMLKSVQKFIRPKGFELCDIGRFRLPTVKHTAKVLYEQDLVGRPIRINQVIKPSIVDRVLRNCDDRPKGKMNV